MHLKKIIIATHFLNYGAAHALRDYLLAKENYELLSIALPFFTQRNTIVEYYSHGKKLFENIDQRKNDNGIVGYILDVVQVVKTVISKKKKFDTFVGVDNLNCLCGLILKKTGKVKKVIYYSIDFVPVRFQNPILNSIYHTIEVFCVKHADEIWNVSPRIAEGRKKFLKIDERKHKQTVVPIGVWNGKIKQVPFSKVKKHQILFLGHLLEKQGLQKVIEAIPQIVQTITDFTLLVIGDGEYMKPLQKIVKKMKVSRHVIFKGWIMDRRKIDEIMSESAAAIALYKPEKDRLHNFSYYADPTKIKDYLSAGLPVILTDVPYNAYDIEKRKCGIVVEYERDQVANAIITTLQDSSKLRSYRSNALAFSKEFEWSTIFNSVKL